MDDRPPIVRGHSDPAQTSPVRSRSGIDLLIGPDDERNPQPALPEHREDNEVVHSAPATPRRMSLDESHPRERHRVRFGAHQDTSTSHQPLDIHHAKPKKSNFIQQRGHRSPGLNGSPSDSSPGETPPGPGPPVTGSPDNTEQYVESQPTGILTSSPSDSPYQLPQQPAMAHMADIHVTDDDDALPASQSVGKIAAQSARSRAEQLSRSLDPETNEAGTTDSDAPSSQISPPPSPELAGYSTTIPHDMQSYISPADINRRRFYRDDLSESEHEGSDEMPKTPEEEDEDDVGPSEHKSRFSRAILRLFKMPTAAESSISLSDLPLAEEGRRSGFTTTDRDRDPEYVRKPTKYRKGVLGILLDTYGSDGFGAAFDRQHPGSEYYRHRNNQSRSGSPTPVMSPGPPSGSLTPVISAVTSGGITPDTSPPPSGQSTPIGKPRRKDKGPRVFHRSPRSPLQSLVKSSASLSAPGASNEARPRPELQGRRGSGALDGLKALTPKRRRYDEVHREIEALRARHHYMILSCKALMRYGAPTHRLEEYMRKSARRLQIDGQFFYLPGCMIISFDSPETGTTEVKIVREDQGVDLSKLRELHDIYKNVIHQSITADSANKKLKEMMSRKPLYPMWVRIFFYGFASATVGPFAFKARPFDMVPSFGLGAFLGCLQLYFSAKSESYSNVFEISAAVVTSFAARGLGAIGGGQVLCLSAIAQSAIALILPGFTVLNAALELQSRSLIAGSVRTVYAIIYALFLGFGITIGVLLYGLIDPDAPLTDQCPQAPLDKNFNFLFVALFTFSLCMVNQAHWRQIPVMIFISLAGYVVNTFVATRFSGFPPITNTCGALVIGLLGNLYSRFYQGMSAAAILPAIFVQVPSGIAASGSLISGINAAHSVTNTSGSGDAQYGSMLNVAFTMVQIAIGLTVGLFFSSLLVYPLGKKRSGLFSF